MSGSMKRPYKAYVTAFLQTDLFLVYLFFWERKAVQCYSLGLYQMFIFVTCAILSLGYFSCNFFIFDGIFGVNKRSV